MFTSLHFTPVGVHYEGGTRNQIKMLLTNTNNIGYNEQETETDEDNSRFRSHFADKIKGNEAGYERRGFCVKQHNQFCHSFN